MEKKTLLWGGGQGRRAVSVFLFTSVFQILYNKHTLQL